MRIDFERELPQQKYFVIRNVGEVVLESIGKLPYSVKTLHNLVSLEKIKRHKVGGFTAISREDFVGLLDRRLNKNDK